MPRFVINYWQLIQINRIIREAYDHVIFYRKFYDIHGIRLESLRKLNDIFRLPIVSKKILRRYPLPEITNDAFASNQYSWNHTSGSTGEPFSFPVSWDFRYKQIFGDNSGEELSISHFDRFFLWKGLSYEYIRKKIKTAIIRSAIIKPRGRYFLPLYLSEFREDPKNFFSKLKEFKPHVIDGRPTALAELARFAGGLPLDKIPQIRFAISSGEVLTSAVRQIIKDVFGAEAYNLYGLEETGVIGAECERHEGMHLFEESCLVEILDEENKPVPRGNFGRIIVTYFNNDVMPFIRYFTGDYGRILVGACGCGLNTLRIEVDGRYGGFIEIGSKKYHSVELEVTLRRFFSNSRLYQEFGAKILHYQFVKKRNGKIGLHIVTKEKITPENIINLQTHFGKKLGLLIDIKIVDDIPYQGNDKTKTFIDESNNNLFHK